MFIWNEYQHDGSLNQLKETLYKVIILQGDFTLSDYSCSTREEQTELSWMQITQKQLGAAAAGMGCKILCVTGIQH